MNKPAMPAARPELGRFNASTIASCLGLVDAKQRPEHHVEGKVSNGFERTIAPKHWASVLMGRDDREAIPICSKTERSKVWPSMGLSSIFQSPVCTMLPSSLRRMRPQQSGMECVTLMGSHLHRQRLVIPPQHPFGHQTDVLLRASFF